MKSAPCFLLILLACAAFTTLSSCALFPPQEKNLPADRTCRVYRGSLCISEPGSQMPDRYCAVYNGMKCVQPVIDTPAMAR